MMIDVYPLSTVEVALERQHHEAFYEISKAKQNLSSDSFSVFHTFKAGRSEWHPPHFLYSAGTQTLMQRFVTLTPHSYSEMAQAPAQVVCEFQ